MKAEANPLVALNRNSYGKWLRELYQEIKCKLLANPIYSADEIKSKNSYVAFNQNFV